MLLRGTISYGEYYLPDQLIDLLTLRSSAFLLKWITHTSVASYRTLNDIGAF